MVDNDWPKVPWWPVVKLRGFATNWTDLLDEATEKADAVSHAADRRTAPRASEEDFMAAKQSMVVDRT